MSLLTVNFMYFCRQTLLLSNMGRVIYPTYKVLRTVKIFKTREDLLRWVLTQNTFGNHSTEFGMCHVLIFNTVLVWSAQRPSTCSDWSGALTTHGAGGLYTVLLYTMWMHSKFSHTGSTPHNVNKQYLHTLHAGSLGSFIWNCTLVFSSVFTVCIFRRYWLVDIYQSIGYW